MATNPNTGSVLTDALRARALTGIGVAVGIQGDGTDRKPDDQGNGGELSNVQVALINEFGSEDAGIPSRPFMRITFAKHKRQWVRAMARALKQAYANDRSGAEATIRTLGVQAVAQMQAVMNDRSNFVPNAPATIVVKTVEGKVGDQPLRDSGQLWQSVRASFETRDGSEAIG